MASCRGYVLHLARHLEQVRNPNESVKGYNIISPAVFTCIRRGTCIPGSRKCEKQKNVGTRTTRPTGGDWFANGWANHQHGLKERVRMEARLGSNHGSGSPEMDVVNLPGHRYPSASLQKSPAHTGNELPGRVWLISFPK
jgi:hypothetical protein